MSSKTGGRTTVSPAVFRAWRSSPAFEAVESASYDTAVLHTAAGVIARPSATVTPGLFTMLGVRAVRGRLFDADEGRAGSADRVLISEEVWRSAFGADPTLIGRTIVIDTRPTVVIGIVPA